MKTAKLFPNGRSQAVRLPKEFRFEDSDEVCITRVGSAVVLMPKRGGWDVLFDALDGFDDDFMAEGRDQPEEEQERDLEL